MKDRLYIITANHRSIIGIRDHIEIMRQLESDTFEIIVTTYPQAGANNLIIEEFTNPYFVEFLRDLKTSAPETRLNLMMTEVPAKDKKGDVVLNPHISREDNFFFRQLSKFLYLIRTAEIRFKYQNSRLPLLERAIKYIKQKFFLPFIKPLKAIVPFKITLKKIIRHAKLRFRKSIVYLIFEEISNRSSEQFIVQTMNERGKALAEIIYLFDGIVDMHPVISSSMKEVFNRDSISIFPEIIQNDELKLPQSDPLRLYCTGARSSYRTQIIKKVESKQHKFRIVDAGFVTFDELHKNADFTLNIPQSEKWPISSPVRIYRSIYAGIIPISYKLFHDHPIENCSISLLDILNLSTFNAHQLRKKVETEIENYNIICMQRTIDVMQALDVSNQQYKSDRASDREDTRILVKSNIPFLLEVYNRWNIVLFLDNYIAVPLSLGDVDVTATDFENDERFICSKRLPELKLSLDEAIEKSIPISEATHLGTLFMSESDYNLVGYGENLYLLGSADGEINLELISEEEAKVWEIDTKRLGQMCFRQAHTLALSNAQELIKPYLNKVFRADKIPLIDNFDQITLGDILEDLVLIPARKKAEIEIFDYTLIFDGENHQLLYNEEKLLDEIGEIELFLKTKLFEYIEESFDDYLIMELRDFNIVSNGNNLFSLRKDQKPDLDQQRAFENTTAIENFIKTQAKICLH